MIPHAARSAVVSAVLLLCAATPGASDPTEGRAATADERARIERVLASGFDRTCLENPGDPARGAVGTGARAITVHEVSYAVPAREEPQAARLLLVACMLGAYSVYTTLFLDDGEGLRPLAFPQPELDIVRVGRDWATLESVAITGWRAETALVDPVFDPRTGLLESVVRWRGLGDASERRVYALHEGRFVLERYEVDPTYDGAQDYILLFARGRTD